MPNSLTKITLNSGAATRLLEELKNRRAVAKQFKSNEWDQLHETFWRLYRGRPEHEKKDFPWPGASNLFIPLTNIAVEGVMAQLYDAMFSNDPFIEVLPMQDDDMDTSELLSQYYGDYLYKEVIPMKKVANDWILNTAVDGTGIVKPRWNREWNVRREQVVEEKIDYETRVDKILGVETRSEVPVGVNVNIRENPIIERIEEPVIDVASMEYLFVAPDSGMSLQWPETRWYFTQQYLNWEDLLDRRRSGYEIPDALREHLAVRDPSDPERTKRDEEALSQTEAEEVLEVEEWYMRWPLPTQYQKTGAPEETEEISQSDDEDGYYEEVIVTVAPRANALLRIVPLQRIYADGKRPHVNMHYTRQPNFPFGIGLPSKMMHLNHAFNSLWNQSIDYGTLQNIPWYFYNPITTGIMPDLQNLRPGRGVPTHDPRGVTFPRFSGDPNFWISSMQQVQAWAEKVSRVNDISLGRAPQTPNAPRTARGTQALLEQGNLAFSYLVALLVEDFTEVYRRVHALHRRWAKPQTEFRLFNKATGMFRRESIPNTAFQRDLDFKFVVNPNRIYENQVSQSLFQIMAPYLAQVNPMGVRTLLKEIWQTAGKKGFDRLWPEQAAPEIGMGGQQPEALTALEGMNLPQPEMPVTSPDEESINIPQTVQ